MRGAATAAASAADVTVHVADSTDSRLPSQRRRTVQKCRFGGLTKGRLSGLEVRVDWKGHVALADTRDVCRDWSPGGLQGFGPCASVSTQSIRLGLWPGSPTPTKQHSNTTTPHSTADAAPTLPPCSSVQALLSAIQHTTASV